MRLPRRCLPPLALASLVLALLLTGLPLRAIEAPPRGGSAGAGSAASAPGAVFFSTGNPDGLMGMATRPATAGKFEIEAGDDFILAAPTTITGATFVGLLSGGATAADVSQVVIEVYRVFPLDSNTVRLPNVPTRVNSPSDVAFDSRDSGAGQLTFTTATISPNFTVNNSVQPGGIHPSPGQTTGGNGPITGVEVGFDVTFNPPLTLPANHYFFVPQVALPLGRDFFWLSSTRPIVTPGTPFAPDLQAWTRDAALDPDWLRVGTDIVGGGTPPTFNGTFALYSLGATPTSTATATSTSTATATTTATAIATATGTVTASATASPTGTGTTVPPATSTATATPNVAATQTAQAVGAGISATQTAQALASPTPVVPELPPLWLFGTGLLALAWLGVRRRR